MPVTISKPVLAAFAAAIAFTGASAVQPSSAQTNPSLSNVIPDSESATLQAKITRIDRSTRAITLRGRSGESVTVTAGPAVRLEKLKVGQTVNAHYFRSVAFMVSSPRGGNETPAPADDQVQQLIARHAEAPGGIGVSLTKITGTVVGINMASHSIDVVNPTGGGIYTLDVTDPSRIAMLSQLQVGDRITAVVSQALAVSVDPAPKSWF